MLAFTAHLHRTPLRAATRLRSARSGPDPRVVRGEDVIGDENPVGLRDGLGADAALDVLSELAYLKRILDRVPDPAGRGAAPYGGDGR